MSPRRSSRARTTQPPSAQPTQSNSNSSASSVRGERSTRSLNNNKQSSPQKSSTPHSLSSDDAANDPPATQQSEPPQTRRRTKREQDAEEEVAGKADDVDDEIVEEEEITRCVCSHQDYPGPPSDAATGRQAKSTHTASSTHAVDSQSDEAGGLFIQCDTCKVWQHGGCVGIMDEAASPDEYFCDRCKPTLHQLKTDRNGQKFSLYRPVTDKSFAKSSHRKSSLSKEPEPKSSKDKDKDKARGAADALTKRRSTMNSRSAYDEDEVLRKVLEESKQEDPPQMSSNGNRKGKRPRDESEDVKPDTKRQRTHSGSLSSDPSSELGSGVESDGEEAKKGTQKPRGAAARSQREKEVREKEKQRADAANSRKGRADRRRADESEAIEEPPVEAENVEPTASQTLTPAPASVVTSKKGKGQPPKKRVYHNQYTRPRETPNEDVPASPRPKSSLRNKKDNNSLSPSSRGANGREKETETNNSMTNGATSDTPTIPLTTTNSNRGKLKQIPRNAGEKTTSMRELERRAAGMLEYILHMQMEAGKRQDSGYARALRLAAEAAGLPVADGVVVVDAERPSTTASSVSERVVEDPKVWREMGTVEMMGSLAVQLEVWQRRFVG